MDQIFNGDETGLNYKMLPSNASGTLLPSAFGESLGRESWARVAQDETGRVRLYTLAESS